MIIAWIIFLAGLALVTYDVLGAFANRRKSVSPCEVDLDNFSFIHLALIHSENKNKMERFAAAEIFNLAQQGKIKIKALFEKGLLSSRKPEIKVEIIKEDDLSEVQQMLLEGLKKSPLLDNLYEDEDRLEEIREKVKRDLIKNKFFSAANFQIRKRMALSSLIFFVPAFLFLLTGVFNSGEIVRALGFALLFVGSGRLLKIISVNLLTGSGRFVKQQIDKLLNKKQQKLENETDYLKLLEELPYLLLDTDFSKSDFKKLLKKQKKEEIVLPKWLEIEKSKEVLDNGDLSKEDILKYSMLQMLFP